MPETIITPTPERSQHDNVIVEGAGKRNVARQRVVDPLYEDWHRKGILTDRQCLAARTFVQDHEQLNRGTQSCLASLDRVDHAGGAVLAETASDAQSRIDAVRASLGPDAFSIVYAVLIYGMKPSNATGKHNQVSQGMVVMALEVMVQCYGLR